MNHGVDLEPRSPVVPHDEEISLLEILNTMLRNWRVIGALPVVLALIVGISTYSQDRTYAASATFVPQIAEGRAGGAAALAQQFGLNLGGDQAGRSPQFYVDLLSSPAVLRPAVETIYEVPDDDGGVARGTLIELLEIESTNALMPDWRIAVNNLSNNLSANYNWETGIIRLNVSAFHPDLAEQIAARLLELLHEFNTGVRQRRAQEEGRFISDRVAVAQTELLAAEGALQEFLRNNRDFRNSPELLFDHDRLQRQVAMRQDVYTSLLRSAEQVRIDGVRDTPLLTVIDQPAGSAISQPRGTVFRAMVAFLIGLMIAVLVAFTREYTRRNREAGDPRYREFEGLARQTWEDLRRPARWLGRREKPVAAGDH